MKKLLLVLLSLFLLNSCSIKKDEPINGLWIMLDKLMLAEEGLFSSAYYSSTLALSDDKSDMSIALLGDQFEYFKGEYIKIKKKLERDVYNDTEAQLFLKNKFTPAYEAYVLSFDEFYLIINSQVLTQEEFDEKFEIYRQESIKFFNLLTAFLDIAFEAGYGMNFLLLDY